VIRRWLARDQPGLYAAANRLHTATCPTTCSLIIAWCIADEWGSQFAAPSILGLLFVSLCLFGLPSAGMPLQTQLQVLAVAFLDFNIVRFFYIVVCSTCTSEW
jgi:hypothetical protein